MGNLKLKLQRKCQYVLVQVLESDVDFNVDIINGDLVIGSITEFMEQQEPAVGTEVEVKDFDDKHWVKRDYMGKFQRWFVCEENDTPCLWDEMKTECTHTSDGNIHTWSI